MDMTQRGSLVVVVQGERVSPERRKDRRHTHTHSMKGFERTTERSASLRQVTSLSPCGDGWAGPCVSIHRARAVPMTRAALGGMRRLSPTTLPSEGKTLPSDSA